MFKKIFVTFLTVLMIVSLLVGCGNNDSSTPSNSDSGGTKTETSDNNQDSTSSGVFKLGAFLQLTGGNSAYGNEAHNAIKLAVKYINERGGFNGEKIDLIVYDTKGSPEEAVKVVTKLIEVDKVDACIGSVNSSEVLAAAGYLNEAGIITFGLGTSPTWMEKDWPYVFRASMNNGWTAPITADLVKKVGISSIAMFYGQDDASLSTAKAFKEACKERGIEVLAEETYDPGDMDFSAQVANMIRSGAQAVYISVIGETGPVIVKQLRQYGYNGLIFDKESFMISQIEIAGKDAANYIIFANPYVTYNTPEECDIEIVREFLELYAAEYGECCKTDSAYRGWDTMMVLWEASKIAKSNDSEALRQAVHKVKIPALGGTLDYTKGDREGYHEFNAFILVDGKNILLDKWLSQGGYEEYKKRTGREY